MFRETAFLNVPYTLYFSLLVAPTAIKEQLLQEIESSSDSLLQETLDFLKFLKTKQAIEKDKIEPLKSTGRSLFDYSRNMDNWEGDDLEECLEAVRKTRTQTRFDRPNPFDE